MAKFVGTHLCLLGSLTIQVGVLIELLLLLLHHLVVVAHLVLVLLVLGVLPIAKQLGTQDTETLQETTYLLVGRVLEVLVVLVVVFDLLGRECVLGINVVVMPVIVLFVLRKTQNENVPKYRYKIYILD